MAVLGGQIFTPNNKTILAEEIKTELMNQLILLKMELTNKDIKLVSELKSEHLKYISELKAELANKYVNQSNIYHSLANRNNSNNNETPCGTTNIHTIKVLPKDIPIIKEIQKAKKKIKDTVQI